MKRDGDAAYLVCVGHEARADDRCGEGGPLLVLREPFEPEALEQPL